MKKIFITLTICTLSLVATTGAVNVEDAISWAYTQGLTVFNEPVSFMASNPIRRDEAAKFFTNFAKVVGKMDYVKSVSQCQFSDLNKARPDLKDIVIEACRLGLFQGANGKFNPTGNISNAEAITVTVRLLYGYQSENSTHWADNYYRKMEELGLISNTELYNKDVPAKRGNIITLIYETNNMIKGVTNDLLVNNTRENQWSIYEEDTPQYINYWTEDRLSYIGYEEESESR